MTKCDRFNIRSMRNVNDNATKNGKNMRTHCGTSVCLDANVNAKVKANANAESGSIYRPIVVNANMNAKDILGTLTFLPSFGARKTYYMLLMHYGILSYLKSGYLVNNLYKHMFGLGSMHCINSVLM